MDAKTVYWKIYSLFLFKKKPKQTKKQQQQMWLYLNYAWLVIGWRLKKMTFCYANHKSKMTATVGLIFSNGSYGK